MNRRIVLAALIGGASACSQREPAAPVTAGANDSEYLYVWTASADSTSPDFLAVLDVRPAADRYGALVTTLPVPGTRNVPHHTEHQLGSSRHLFASGTVSGRSFIFDLTDPAQPRLAVNFTDQAGLSHPHSFLRLPNGNVLATFQMTHAATGRRPGGLVELTDSGRVIRSSSSDGPGVPAGLRTYSAGIVPSLDRIITTTTDMDESNPYPANQLQIWRLSDLALLHTITLPPGPHGEASFSAEPRVLGDGRTVLVTTFSCGLYLLQGLETETPAARLVGAFPRSKDTYCAIPVVSGHFLLMTVPYSDVVSLDISDPAHPRVAARLTLPPGQVPHWIALEPNTRRLVLTGYGTLENRVLLATFDSATGALALDRRFREEGDTVPGFRLAGRTWPHGSTAAGVPHGSVFSLPPGNP
jgi:hypothetical protein